MVYFAVQQVHLIVLDQRQEGNDQQVLLAVECCVDMLLQNQVSLVDVRGTLVLNHVSVPSRWGSRRHRRGPEK